MSYWLMVRKLTQILSSNFLLLMQVTNDAGVFFYSQSLKIPVFITFLQFYTSYYGIKDGIGMSLNRGFFFLFSFNLLVFCSGHVQCRSLTFANFIPNIRKTWNIFNIDKVDLWLILKSFGNTMVDATLHLNSAYLEAKKIIWIISPSV